MEVFQDWLVGGFVKEEFFLFKFGKKILVGVVFVFLGDMDVFGVVFILLLKEFEKFEQFILRKSFYVFFFIGFFDDDDDDDDFFLVFCSKFFNIGKV